MGILDFKEIPAAHKATGKQDNFELFARDFLEYSGFKILSDPDRGPDGGKDLIVQEIRRGIGGETEINWLVSCKHLVFSGSSVGLEHEKDIIDRVESNSCNGFIGFYSTLAASGLSDKIKGLKSKIEYMVYDYEKIERELLKSADGILLARRYFIHSMKKWEIDNPIPAEVYVATKQILCDNCGKNLLDEDANGIIVLLNSQKSGGKRERLEGIYCACKGYCDRKLEEDAKMRDLNTGWEDIEDLKMPTLFLKWIISTMNQLYSKKEFSEEAFSRLKEFYINIFPYVARNITPLEKERLDNLFMIPSYLGGLGE